MCTILKVCGHSSVVERLVANEKVEGSNPLPAPVYDRFIKKKCVACDGNIPPFDLNEIHKYLKKLMVGMLKAMMKRVLLNKRF